MVKRCSIFVCLLKTIESVHNMPMSCKSSSMLIIHQKPRAMANLPLQPILKSLSFGLQPSYFCRYFFVFPFSGLARVIATLQRLRDLATVL